MRCCILLFALASLLNPIKTASAQRDSSYSYFLGLGALGAGFAAGFIVGFAACFIVGFGAAGARLGIGAPGAGGLGEPNLGSIVGALGRRITNAIATIPPTNRTAPPIITYSHTPRPSSSPSPQSTGALIVDTHVPVVESHL